MNNPSDEIKSRLDIVDVIRDYMPLTAAGVNFRARCPFHREKTPSFMISPEKQIFHCFGCGKGGDIFAFVMEMEGLTFVEALRLLAPKAGVVLKKADPQLTSQRNRLLDMVEMTSRYYHELFLKSPSAAPAREYLKKRGLTEEVIEEWRIGYSPDEWDNLLSALKNKGYNENEIFLAGLSVRKNQGGGFYDRFRGRIMFPIRDINGQTVAFSARVSPEKEATEQMGKYINSPQSMIYDKSKILFGLDMAKQSIRQKDQAVITEGQMDAITAHQFGYKNVVAASGTALTAEQVNLIKRYTKNIVLAFDMDAAGETASERGIREAMAAEMNIKVIILPAGKDPDEAIRQNQSEWDAALIEAKPMMQYYFDKTFAKLDLSVADDKSEAARILLPIIAKLGNRIEQDFWLKQLSQAIGTDENLIREKLSLLIKKERSSPNQAGGTVEAEARPLTREEKLSELLLALILQNSNVLEFSLNHIQVDNIAGDTNRAIYRNLVFYYNNIVKQIGDLADDNTANLLNYLDFKNWLISENTGMDSDDLKRLIGHLDSLAMTSDKEFYNFDLEQAKNEAIKIIIYLKRSYLQARMKELERLISQAETEKNISNAGDLMQELKVLTDEYRNIG